MYGFKWMHFTKLTIQLVKYKSSDIMCGLLETSARLTDAICRACTCESVRHALLNFSYLLAYISHLLTENGFSQIMTDISSHLLTEIDFSQIITDISHFVTDIS